MGQLQLAVELLAPCRRRSRAPRAAAGSPSSSISRGWPKKVSVERAPAIGDGRLQTRLLAARRSCRPAQVEDPESTHLGHHGDLLPVLQHATGRSARCRRSSGAAGGASDRPPCASSAARTAWPSCRPTTRSSRVSRRKVSVRQGGAAGARLPTVAHSSPTSRTGSGADPRRPPGPRPPQVAGEPGRCSASTSAVVGVLAPRPGSAARRPRTAAARAPARPPRAPSADLDEVAVDRAEHVARLAAARHGHRRALRDGHRAVPGVRGRAAHGHDHGVEVGGRLVHGDRRQALHLGDGGDDGDAPPATPQLGRAAGSPPRGSPCRSAGRRDRRSWRRPPRSAPRRSAGRRRSSRNPAERGDGLGQSRTGHHGDHGALVGVHLRGQDGDPDLAQPSATQRGLDRRPRLGRGARAPGATA